MESADGSGEEETRETEKASTVAIVEVKCIKGREESFYNPFLYIPEGLSVLRS
jgi:hypothetical protein